MRSRALLALLLAVLAAGLTPSAAADEEPALDWEGSKPALLAEPDYVAQPLYALFLFGGEKKVGAWAVLDRSSVDSPHYDVLYFDRDADGDLTEEGERITAKWNERGARAGMGIDLRVGDFREPGTDVVHTGIRVSTVRKPGRKGVWVQLEWRDRHRLSGGQTRRGDCTEWGRSPEEAPVLRPSVREPFSFEIWAPGRDEVELAIGKETALRLMAGIRGSRDDTLLTVDEDFFDLETEKIRVTLLARSRSGKPIEVSTDVTGHC